MLNTKTATSGLCSGLCVMSSALLFGLSACSNAQQAVDEAVLDADLAVQAESLPQIPAYQKPGAPVALIAPVMDRSLMLGESIALPLSVRVSSAVDVLTLRLRPTPGLQLLSDSEIAFTNLDRHSAVELSIEVTAQVEGLQEIIVDAETMNRSGRQVRVLGFQVAVGDNVATARSSSPTAVETVGDERLLILPSE